MVDQSELRDLPPDRFGAVVAAVIERVWDGDVDVAPPSPGGVVDAVIRDGGGEWLLHARQSDRVGVGAVESVARLASERGFDAVTLMATGPVTEEGRAAARDGGVDVVDGESFASLVDDADVEATSADGPSVATVVSQLAGHWPEHLREVAVELATTIEGTAEVDRELTRGSRRTDVDFRDRDDGRVVARMRFLRTSLLVYVRRGDAMESVVRLAAHREALPSLRELETDLRTALARTLEE